jgi:hypothetical protein
LSVVWYFIKVHQNYIDNYNSLNLMTFD